MIETILREIGLTESEIKVYLALLELGSTTTGPIVDKSGVSSSKIYEILEKLAKKGLVSHIIKAGTKHFEASDPERIMDYLEEKKNSLTDQIRSVKTILPQLEIKRQLTEHISEATIFKGFRGIQTAFKELLKDATPEFTMLVMGFSKSIPTIENWMHSFHRQRAENKIPARLIMPETRPDLGKTRSAIPLTKIKYLPQDMFIPSVINIYKDKVLIVIDEEFTSIMIKNKEVADSFTAQFENLWKQDTTIIQGFKALDTYLRSFIDDLKENNEPYLTIGAAFGVKKFEKKYVEFFRKIGQYRVDQKLDVKMLFQQGTEEFVKNNIDVYGTAQIKYLPYETKTPVVIIPSKKKTLLLIQKDRPTTIEINNQDIGEAFVEQFNTLWNQDVKIIKGFENVTNKFTSMLHKMKKGEEYLVLGANYGLGGEKLKDWFIKYHKKRHKKGIKAKLLAHQSHKGAVEQLHQEINQAGKDPFSLAQYRKLPPEYSSPMQINLYAPDKVLMFLWEEEMVCFEMKSKTIYNNFKSQFENLWNQNVKIIKGETALKQFFYDCLDDFKKGEEYGAFGSTKLDKKFISFFQEYHQKRIEKDVKVKLLFNNKTLKGLESNALVNSELRQSPLEFDYPMLLQVFKDKIGIILYDENIAIEIDNKKIRDNFKNFFDSMWAIGKEFKNKKN